MRIGIAIAIAMHASLLVGCDSKVQRSKPATQATAMKPSTAPATQASEATWPLTVPQAVDRLVAGLSEKSKATIRAMPREDMISLHHSLGRWVRNNFGLWQGNTALLRDTGEGHPDDASGVILDALWVRLQSTKRNK